MLKFRKLDICPQLPKPSFLLVRLSFVGVRCLVLMAIHTVNDLRSSKNERTVWKLFAFEFLPTSYVVSTSTCQVWPPAQIEEERRELYNTSPAARCRTWYVGPSTELRAAGTGTYRTCTLRSRSIESQSAIDHRLARKPKHSTPKPGCSQTFSQRMPQPQQFSLLTTYLPPISLPINSLGRQLELHKPTKWIPLLVLVLFLLLN